MFVNLTPFRPGSPAGNAPVQREANITTVEMQLIKFPLNIITDLLVEPFDGSRTRNGLLEK